MRTLSYLAPLALANAAAAHMYMASPADIRGKENPNAGANVDSDITSNLRSDGSNYPCKGNLKLLGTPQGAPVASWAAGSAQKVTIAGGAPHGGGSCQVSLSLDRGATFRVLHTWVGGCPAAEGGASSFDFRVPGDVPASKEAVFSWTWFNKLGGQPEMYQGCAVVETTGGGGSESVAFDSRPAPFVANIGNGCTTQPGIVKIPNPGPDVDVAAADALPPTGNCGPSAPATGSGSSGSSVSSGSGAGSGSGPGAGSSGPGSGSGSNSGYGSGSGSGSGSSGAGKGYTPGNDWPAGYGVVGEATKSEHMSVLLLCALFVIGPLLFDLWRPVET